MPTSDRLGSASLFYEDFQGGDEFRSAGRTVTEADVVGFAGLSGDFSALHMNAPYAEQSAFGGRIAHGLCGVAIASGLFVQLRLWEETAIAVLSTTWNFKAPIFLGDTITLEASVRSRRETSKPDRGIVEFDLAIVNQKEALVTSGEWVQMFRRRPHS